MKTWNQWRASVRHLLQRKSKINSREVIDDIPIFLCRSKKRRKTNKTGFPTPKKKKKTNQEESVKIKKSSESQKSPSKTDSKPSKKSPKKVGPSSQKKMDEFIIKKGKSSPVASASKRSVALKAKNYR